MLCSYLTYEDTGRGEIPIAVDRAVQCVGPDSQCTDVKYRVAGNHGKRKDVSGAKNAPMLDRSVEEKAAGSKCRCYPVGVEKEFELFLYQQRG